MDAASLTLQLQVLAHAIIASVLAGLVGFEREMAKKPAGLRTHILVAISASVMIALGQILPTKFAQGNTLIQADPIRIVEAIIVGVSFIGGGIIMQNKHEHHVENLTTAASILLAAVIGICVSLEQYILATAITVLVLLVNHTLLSVTKNLPE